MDNRDSTTSTPRPGQHLPAPGGASSSVSPDDVAQAISEMLEQLDEVSRRIVDANDDSPVSAPQLAGLDRQADLLERAHRVLADALAAIDHA